MNILIVPKRYPNPYTPHNYEFVRSQIKILSEVYNVEVVCCITLSIRDILKQGIKNLGIQCYKENNVQINMLILPSIPKAEKINDFIRYLGNKFLIKIYVKKIDLIHIHTYEAAKIAHYYKQKYNIPYVITEHSSRLLAIKNEDYSFEIAKKAFELSSANIAVSTVFAKQLAKIFKKKFHILPNVIDTNFFNPTHKNHQKNHNKIRLLTVGNLIGVKNHFFMIDVIHRLIQCGLNVQLNIVGEGPLKSSLNQYIQKLNLQKSIFLHGFQNSYQIKTWMEKSDIFLMTSKNETFCVAVAEAMSMKLPIVCTNFGGIASEIKNLRDCYVSEIELNSFSSALLKVINIGKFCSIENRQFVIDNYSESSFLKQISFIYNNVFLEKNL